MGAALQLTVEQQAAYEDFARFVVDPQQSVFVLEGYAGTGKSTLVKYLIEQIDKLFKTLKLVDPTYKSVELVLSATTNKAAEAFQFITGKDVRTIHSVLQLRVMMDYSNNTSRLVTAPNSHGIKDTLLVVDEASGVDSQLLDYIFKRTHNCKIMFIGDPAQLALGRGTSTPVFSAGFPTAQLTEVVRQAKGNPIIALSSLFRNTVNSGDFFQFAPDNHHIQWMDQEKFEEAIVAEFNRPDWHDKESKVLAWTNKTVIGYNNGIRNLVKGSPEFSVGDYVINNNYIYTQHCQLKTDQLVCITKKEPAVEHNISGFILELDGRQSAFMPTDNQDKKRRIKLAKDQGENWLAADISKSWIDLRAVYSCTINKSQGSTYNKVFIDLDDVRKCNNKNQVARMLYVAVSRARHQVIFTGDLV